MNKCQSLLKLTENEEIKNYLKSLNVGDSVAWINGNGRTVNAKVTSLTSKGLETVGTSDDIFAGGKEISHIIKFTDTEIVLPTSKVHRSVESNIKEGVAQHYYNTDDNTIVIPTDSISMPVLKKHEGETLKAFITDYGKYIRLHLG